MSKLTIKNKLYIFSALLPLGIAILGAVMYWLNAGMASNVNYSNTNNLVLKSLPFITYYLHILLDIAFVAISVSAISYARVYFGPATSSKICLITIAAYAFSEVLSYIFSIFYNSFNAADLKAKLISLAIELVFIALLDFITPVFSSLYVKRITKNASKVGRLKTALASVPTLIIYFVIKFSELISYTLNAVKSFILQGNTISSAMIVSIIIDVIYYIVLYFAVPLSITLLTSYVLVRLTGPLKLKIKGDSFKK